MILIKSDEDRRIDIPGVAAPVRRPVDIDQSQTGFKNLRTLRIYRFDKEAVIEGHAEEDEVFLIVLAGSAELTLVEAPAMAGVVPNSVGPMMLAAPGLADGACVAYLPPHAAYKLIPKTDADVAYARATPSSDGRAKVFFSSAREVAPGVKVLLEEVSWAERLRLRLMQFDASGREIAFELSDVAASPYECFVYIATSPAEGSATIHSESGPAIALTSWDTVAVAPGETPTLRFVQGSWGMALIVVAPLGPTR